MAPLKHIMKLFAKHVHFSYRSTLSRICSMFDFKFLAADALYCIVPPFARPILSVRSSVCPGQVRTLRKRWEIGLVLLWWAYRNSPPGYSGDTSPTSMTTHSSDWGIYEPKSKLALQIATRWCQIQQWFVLTAYGNTQLPYPTVPLSSTPRGTPSPKRGIVKKCRTSAALWGFPTFLSADGEKAHSRWTRSPPLLYVPGKHFGEFWKLIDNH